MTLQHQTTERVKRDIVRLCHAGLDSYTFRKEVIGLLRKVIPLDLYFFATADPATLLFTSVVTDEVLERVTPQFLENEFLQDDVNKFFSLTQGPAGSMAQATQGVWTSSQRYQDILAPLALGDELRAALIIKGVCWGFVCLHREHSSAPIHCRRGLLPRRAYPTHSAWIAKCLALLKQTRTSASRRTWGPLTYR